MDGGITVDFTGRRLEDLRLEPLGEAKHVDRAMHGRLRRLNRVVLIVHRGCRAREIVDLVHLHRERQGHVVAHELEARMMIKVIDVPLRAREEVVDAQNVVPLVDQPVDKMGAQKSGAAGHKDTFAALIEARHRRADLCSGSGERSAGDLPLRPITERR